MKKTYFGYLALSRNFVSLVILGCIKTRHKMLVCQVLCLIVLWFKKKTQTNKVFCTKTMRAFKKDALIH